MGVSNSKNHKGSQSATQWNTKERNQKNITSCIILKISESVIVAFTINIFSMTQNDNSKRRITTEQWTVVALSIATLAAWVFQNFIFSGDTKIVSPVWLQPAAAVLAAVGIIKFSGGERVWKVIYMTGLLFMVWAANKVLFDFLTMAGLIGDPATGQRAHVDWPGTISRILAFAAAVLLTRHTLKAPASGSERPAVWYGYAAFIVALPYPLFRIIWALGGTPGITHPGAAGEGFEPVIIAIPWILAAILSLLLVSPRKWKPRKFLLLAGWTATAIVASIGPIALWSMISGIFLGEGQSKGDIAAWVFCMFYTSWFLWAIFGFAATRSYQLRSTTESSRA